MIDTIVLFRTRRHFALTLFSAFALTAGSYLNVLEWRSGGRLFSFLVFCGLGVFAGLIWTDLLRRRIFGQVGPDGLVIRGPFRDVHVMWEQLVWAKRSEDANTIVFGYQAAGSLKERYSSLNAKVIGQGGIDALWAAIKTQRPELPDDAPQSHAV